MLLTTDLSFCDRELIHIPGSIQPHGMMLVADRRTLLVTHIAGDAERRLGDSAWHNRPLAILIGEALAKRIAAIGEADNGGGFVGRLETASGENLELSAHRSGSSIIVELEPAAEERPASLVLDGLAAATAGFGQAGSLKALCERAAVEFRRLTGFDRVMVYRFLEDGAGTVLAEDRRGDLHSFLNHHFPASDIPVQARALYLQNLIRVIPDIFYEPAPLRPEWTETEPLDLSDSSLRSVSPIHLKYLNNMGIKASASVSIVKDGALWGLIACHNETPKMMTYEVRAAARALAGSLSRQIKANDETDNYRQRIRLRSFEEDIVKLLSREGPLDEAISHHLGEARRMFGGDGIAVLRGNELAISGPCPDKSDIRALAAWISDGRGGPVFSIDNISAIYPPGAKFQDCGSGILTVTLSDEDPWMLIWFRAEQIETVNWAGNPYQSKTLGPNDALTPRASFEAWQETVRGRARAWSLPETEAASRLRTALLEVQQNRRVLELNRQLTKILKDKDMLLEQKEFLIGEVNHRVQNSLQLVSSFLSLQSYASDNPELHAALEEARRRLSAVALVHRRLYRGNQIETIDLARYIEELSEDTITSLGQEWAAHLSLSLSPVMISRDRAVTVGLVLTELMINANKYAYGGAAGPLEIQLSADRAAIQLIVSDKGGGKVTAHKGFGSRMMEGLVTQLGGELTYSDNHPGLRAILTTPIELPLETRAG